MEKKKFYLTTAIAYTSSVPHIGNVYEAILADSIVRYKRKKGFDVYFQTGTDEHGQKIEQKAVKLGLTPKEHVDNIAGEIKRIYERMNISYDHFFRATDEYHMEEVQNIFKKLYDQGDIYLSEYEGNYCVDCESYYTEKDLVDGKCPDCGAAVHLTKEETYFLKLAKYQDRLIKYINDNPNFIQPESRKNEMLNNFLKEPLPDLCVSRTSYKWGIPVSFNDKHVIYVWIDALCNYLTGIGYHVNKENGELMKYWPADIHLIGKDILRFHTIYWPIMLMALGIELPKQVFGHPWILFNNTKMSKSKGNLIYTDELVDTFGVDKVRYYCLHDIPFAQDGNCTYELVAERTNTDLANVYGNLANRSFAMTKKYFNGTVSYKGILLDVDKELQDLTSSTINSYYKYMDELKVSDAVEEVITLLRRANKYVDETEPWVLAKDEAKKEVLENVLYHLLEVVRTASILLENIMPTSINEFYKMLGNVDTTYESLNDFSQTKTYMVLESKVLFNRLDINEIIKSLDIKEEKAEVIEEVIPSKDIIGIEDFDKVELVVGKILEASNHPKADKLLVFKVDIKSEVRQIVSGIAKFYNPDDLIGKKVVVVKNLKKINLRGVESNGMLLCASNKDDTKLELINIEGLNPGDIVC